MSLKTYLPLMKTYRLPLSIFCLAVACTVASAAGAGEWLVAPPPPTPAAAPSDSARQRVETERVTVRPTGLYPAQITRPQGEFILAVDNLSGLRELNLVLERDNGERVRERRLTLEQFKWKTGLDLPPAAT